MHVTFGMCFAAANLAFEAFADSTPYIVLATAPNGSNTFTLLMDTKTPTTEDYINGSIYPANRILSATQNNINRVVEGGTRVAIACGIDTARISLSQIYLFYYTGGILLR